MCVCVCVYMFMCTCVRRTVYGIRITYVINIDIIMLIY